MHTCVCHYNLKIIWCTCNNYSCLFYTLVHLFSTKNVLCLCFNYYIILLIRILYFLFSVSRFIESYFVCIKSIGNQRCQKIINELMINWINSVRSRTTNMRDFSRQNGSSRFSALQHIQTKIGDHCGAVVSVLMKIYFNIDVCYDL